MTCKHDPAGFDVDPDTGDVWCFRCRPPRLVTAPVTTLAPAASAGVTAPPDPTDWKPWKFEKCCVCNGGFSEKSWDDRHTHPQTGGDCHARCCPWCKN